MAVVRNALPSLTFDPLALSNKSSQTIRDMGGAKFTVPQYKDPPSLSFKLQNVARVARLVSRNLGQPVV